MAAQIFLNQLSNRPEGCSLKVRVSRMWDTLNIRKGKQLMSTDMVLIDEKANSIHATIPKNLAPSFKRLLEEGKIYVVTKFDVIENKATYAVVRNNPSMIEFCLDTTVTEEVLDENIIPQHAFEFVNLGELKNRVKKEMLTDVIGVIIQVNPVEEKMINHSKVDMMTLQLKDKSGNVVRVTLWDDYVRLFGQILEKQMSNAPNPNIAIFSSTIVKTFNDEIMISSSSATKIYINIDIPEATDLLQSFKHSNDVDASENMNITHFGLHPKVERVKTISELLCSATSMIDKSAVYYCVATVSDILLKNGWYYVSCPNCKKGASPTATNFKCEHCKDFVAYPVNRFRLELQVKDSLESTIFVVFNEVAEQLAKVKLTDLTSNVENDNTEKSSLPHQLQQIIGTTHIFQIKLGTYFESRGRKSFTSNKILKPVIKIEKEDNIATPSCPSSGSLIIQTPKKTQKRRRLRLQSDDESEKLEENGNSEIVEDVTE